MLRWFICPDKEKTEVSDCISGKCRMGNRCAPLGYLQLCARQRKWDGTPSVTQLIDGTRKQFLMIRTDYAEDPKDCAWKVLGTKSHAGLDEDNDLSFTEEKFVEDGISGTADLIEQQPNGDMWLIDYKVSGSYKVAQALGIVKVEREKLDEHGNVLKYKNGKPQKDVEWVVDPLKRDVDDWALQLNAYRLLVEKQGFKITALKIFTIVRDGRTYVAEGRGVKDPYAYIDIPMKTDEEVREYFNGKRDVLVSAMDSGNVPAPCSPSETWSGRKCNGYCPVKDECLKYGNPYIINHHEGGDE